MKEGKVVWDPHAKGVSNLHPLMQIKEGNINLICITKIPLIPFLVH